MPRLVLGPRLVALGAWLALLTSSSAAQPTVTYELTDQPGGDGDAGHWQVRVLVRGLRPEDGALGLVSTGWGWPRDWPYLELLESEPPLDEQAGDGSSLTLRQPEGWDGCARILYRVRLTRRGSEEHRRFGLAPSRGRGQAYGNSLNVLLRPTQAGRFLAAEVELQLVAAAADEVLVTGWAGRATGRQRVTPDRPWGNAPIVFGAPTATATTATARDGRFAVEVFQYAGPDATPGTVELVQTLVPAMQRATGWPARWPARVFLSDAMAGGMGSEYGLHMNVPADADPGFERTPAFRTTLAHELFHEWLGIRLHESSGSLVWFREGFTEYFAQWFSVATGLLGPGAFAETLEEYDGFARRSTSLGRVAFADPGVDWRDGDGPNELMAYRGAPVLALALDVELRAAGHPGLLQLVRDLLEREDPLFPPEALREWFVASGLEARWEASIAGRAVPAARDSLVRAGFEPADVALDVAYLGLQTVEEKPTWRVLAVEGPAARAGVQVGDVIRGFFPCNGAPTRLQELATPYTFGLALFTPGIEGSFLGIERAGAPLQLPVEPELRPWGRRSAWRAGTEAWAFFTFTPR